LNGKPQAIRRAAAAPRGDERNIGGRQREELEWRSPPHVLGNMAAR
jgi:hypothetical protein